MTKLFYLVKSLAIIRITRSDNDLLNASLYTTIFRPPDSGARQFAGAINI